MNLSRFYLQILIIVMCSELLLWCAVFPHAILLAFKKKCFLEGLYERKHSNAREKVRLKVTKWIEIKRCQNKM